MDREPSFVYYPAGTEDTLVGEFHFGSASEEEVLTAGKGIKLFLTDPPYNLGFDYGEVSDNQPEEDYHQMMEDVVDACYEAADDDAHMFLIHYPQDFAKMWPRLTKKWKFHQWITWAYPANFGHSTKKWTNASRTILWLVKGDPEFYGDRVVQPYKNPWDRRIKKLIHEEGKIGTPLYNWWQVNLCKNVSKDKKEYSNQIPEELLERIVLSTTNLGDLVADPFSGTFSTSRTAMRLGRRAWGCDLNSDVIKWRPTLTDYDSEPKIDQPKYDREYPFYKFEEAGLTIQQIHKISAHLLETLSPEQIAEAPGIGIKKARELRKNLSKSDTGDQPTLIDFSDSKIKSDVDDEDSFRICVPRHMIEDQKQMTSNSKVVRLAKIRSSISWPSSEDKESKIFTPSNDSIGNFSLSYGKPGLYYPKKPHDMRPRVSSSPNWFPPSDEIHLVLSQLWMHVPDIAREINSLLVRLMWCVDFNENGKGEYILCLPAEIEDRLNAIDRECRDILGERNLIDVILMTEGIAHNDDVITYTRNDDKVLGQAGRILAIKTLMWIGKRNSDAIKNIDLQSSKSKDELLKDFAETVTELTRTGMKSITEAELIDYVNICSDEEE